MSTATKSAFVPVAAPRSRAIGTDELASIVEAEILDGCIAPGERLDELALAKRFGVSRTPVREALNRLSASGLIEIRRNTGVFVTSLTLADVMELYEAVTEIDSIVTRLAARRATLSQRQELLRLADEFREIAERGDIDAFAAKNVAFHSQIYDAAHNRYLAQQARQARRRVWAFRRLHFRAPGRMQKSTDEHVALARAISDGDEDRLMKILQGHNDVKGEAYNDFLMVISRHLRSASALA